MTDITNTQAVHFCNEKVRPAADKLAQAYYHANQVIDEWNATGMSSLIPNDSSPIIDGSATDGRKPITGAKATNIITRLIEFTDDYKANSNAKLNTVIGVSVNNG